MGLILKPLRFLGDKSEATLEALFHTGARSSAIRREVAVRLATLNVLRRPVVFGLADQRARIRAREIVVLEVRLDGKVLPGHFYALPHLRRDVVIGADFLQNWSIRLDPRSESLTVGADPKNIELFAHGSRMAS